MNCLQQILDNSQLPILTAFILGLLTAISPCPLATNITAIGYIGKSIENRHRMFLNGLLYTLGRVVGYAGLGAILIYIVRTGEDFFMIQKYVSKWGELLIAPALILIGFFMLVGHHLQLQKFGFLGNVEGRQLRGSWGSFLLGLLFALAFCPTSGVLYFGMLIPLSAQVAEGYFLPIVFALATGIPVILVAWVLAFSISSIGGFYNKMQILQWWLNRIVALLFIAVGAYYAVMFYF